MIIETIMRGSVELYSHYIYTLLLLFPLVVYYLFLIINRYSVRRILVVQKLLVSGLCILPIVLTLLTFTTTQSPAFIPTVNSIAMQQDDFTSPISFNGSGDMRATGEQELETTTKANEIGNLIAVSSTVLLSILASLAFIGLGLFLLRLTVQHRYLKAIRRSAQVEQITGGITLCKSHKLVSAFSTHLLKKTIYLPSDLSPDHTEVVILHELNHFRRHHHIWQFLEHFIVHLYWFNPLSFFIRKIGETYRELECDELTTQQVDRFRYSKVLLEAAESSQFKQSQLIFGHAWNCGNTLKQRIHHLLGKKNNDRLRRLKLGLLALCTATLSGCFVFDYATSESLEKRLLETIEKTTEEQRRDDKFVEIDKVPKHFVDILLFAEDKRFYTHSGFDTLAFLRSTSRYLQNHLFNGNRRVGGASTLTMQLAKFKLYEMSEGYISGSISYKALQIRAASIIEQHFSKNEILSMYLSSIYLGYQNDGIKLAAEFYFNLPYYDLSPQQSAVLIQSLQAPSIFNLSNAPDNSNHRGNTLLREYRANLSI